jgi:hypothetical protein
MGFAASFPMDEKMANPGGASSGAGILDTAKNQYLYLAVLLFGGAIYLGCIVSPPCFAGGLRVEEQSLSRLTSSAIRHRFFEREKAESGPNHVYCS